MFSNPKFWAVVLLVGVALPYVALKLMSLTGKRPERSADIPSQLAACPVSPNCVCSEGADESHSVAPIKFSGEAVAAWEKMQSVLADIGGEKVRAEDGYLWFCLLYTSPSPRD